MIFHDQGKHAEALAECQRAIALDPRCIQAHHNLSVLLFDQGKFEEAVQELRKALALDPTSAGAHGSLAYVLHEQGQLEEAAREYRRAAELGAPSALENARFCEQSLKLRLRLPGVLKGQDRPTDVTETLAFAALCQKPFERRYALATRLYGDALAADPTLVDNPKNGHRYNAACCAALAGCGQGQDASQLDDQEKARHRQQALTWLQADLAHWSRQAQSAKPEDRTQALQRLRSRQREEDLAGVRGEAALAKLPAGEAEAWRKLWSEVERLLADTKGKQ
jgi:tetratricopeptide (TPR) repeat protein